MGSFYHKEPNGRYLSLGMPQNLSGTSSQLSQCGSELSNNEMKANRCGYVPIKLCGHCLLLSHNFHVL
jgi:hypothetical protein